MTHHVSWLEAAVVGLGQGVSELFPVSSLGHSVLIPAVIGGSWAHDLNVSTPESPYLAFIVGLHVATAAALILFFWRDWLRIISGLVTSIRYRRVQTADERLAWLLILATIPVGLAGVLLEHAFRTVLAKPNPTAVFLMLNGLILFAAERYRRRAVADPGPRHRPPSSPYAEARHRLPQPGAAVQTEVEPDTARDVDVRLSRLPLARAILIGSAQIAALAPGISRSGITMSTGLARGLDHEDAARFSFLLATPVILAAGVLKLPDLAGPLGAGIRAQILLGSALSFIGAYLSVRFLTRYFRTNSLRPFGWYCLAAGAVALILVNR